jgi:hypothetical protein
LNYRRTRIRDGLLEESGVDLGVFPDLFKSTKSKLRETGVDKVAWSRFTKTLFKQGGQEQFDREHKVEDLDIGAWMVTMKGGAEKI